MEKYIDHLDIKNEKVNLNDLAIGNCIMGDYNGYDKIIDRYTFKNQEHLTTINDVLLGEIVRGDKETPRILKKTYKILSNNESVKSLNLVNVICLMKKGEDLNEYEKLFKIGGFED